MRAVLDGPGAAASAAAMQVAESAAVVAPVAGLCLVAAANVPAATCLPDCQAANEPTPTVHRQSVVDRAESVDRAMSRVVATEVVGLLRQYFSESGHRDWHCQRHLIAVAAIHPECPSHP